MTSMASMRTAATEGKWSEVLNMYEGERKFRTAEITSTGDTVLHMAVSRGHVEIVKEMVDFFCNKQDKDSSAPSSSYVDENASEKKLVLGAKNKKGNTPLHLAASMGNVEICKKISGAVPSLIVDRNCRGETPLFVAVLHGNKDAFLWLNHLYTKGHTFSSANFLHCIRRKNGDNVLHCALEKRHIDMAMEIVLLYKVHLKEMNKPNRNGLSPLHILAANPSAFASTDVADRSFVVRLLYHWFFRVKEKTEATKVELEPCERKTYVDAGMDALVKYGSIAEEVAVRLPCCIASIWMLIVFPMRFLAWVLLILLIVFKILLLCVSAAGIWFYGILFHGIRNMKEKHTWSLQIVEELLRSGSYPGLFEELYKTETEKWTIIVDTPLMIAAKIGVVEMVEKILKEFPYMMKDVNEEEKNIVLLAAEKRQTNLYQFLCGNEYYDKRVFSQVDCSGNTAFHLAAHRGTVLDWEATTMVEEHKWFEFVRCSVPSELREKSNNDGETAKEIFRRSSKGLMRRDRQWLYQTSQTCSVASTLIASMAFSNIVAEDFDEKNYSTLATLSLSLTSTISFLAILAFRSQSLNLWRCAHFMLQIAILTMFGSIVTLWITLVLNAKSSPATYAILGMPIAILTIVSLPIFIGPTLTYLFAKVPAPNRNTMSDIDPQRIYIKENATDVNRNQEPTPNMESGANDSLQNIGVPMKQSSKHKRTYSL